MVSLLTQNLTFTNDQMTVLEKAFSTAQELLSNFSSSEDFMTDLRYIFGNQIQNTTVKEVFQALAQQSAFFLEIIAENQINNALGAYAQATNTIYLSQEFIEKNLNNYQAIAAVLLEETGHYIDAHLNPVDTSGDEGELFAAKIQHKTLDTATQNRIVQENDSYTVTLDGQEITIEQATPGINPAFDLIGLTQLRNDPQFAGIDGSGVTAVIIDTGLDQTHPLLQPNYRTGVDFINGGDNPVDYNGHGTHVSGTVGAADENIGVASQTGLIGLQVFQSGGNTSNSTVEEALEWVYNNRQQYNIVVVNMSLGGGFYSSPEEIQGDILSDDIRRLEEIGVTVVAAGGNSFKNNEYQNYGAPAIYSTLAVGAVWQDGNTQGIQQFGDGSIDYTTGSDRIISFSQRLVANNTIFAPGAFINSIVPGGGQELYAGTSQASPHVAGAVALMQEAALQFGGRLLAPSEVVEIMRGTADSIFDGDDEDDNVQNTNVSYPRLNIYRAISEIKNRFGNNAPPPGGNTGSQGTYNITVQQAIDPAQYGASHSDLIQFFGYNLSALKNHFQTIGRLEGRNPDTFDELRYTASNPDLIPIYRFDSAGATQHYIQSGYFEGRSLIAFEPNQYLASNLDLIGVFGDNLTEITRHYVQNGFFEPRSSDSFDELRYLASNKDLIQVFGLNPVGATQHYIQSGYFEGRSLIAFEADRYIASNPDLIGALGYNLLEGTLHYINYGALIDNRSTTSFDAVNYLNRYSDLQAVFNGDLTAATRHFIEHGFFENRIGS